MKILVVEDDLSVAKSLELLLSSCHYAVDTATDGEAGLRMAEAFAYDLFLLDVVLPKIDGISLCQRLRSMGIATPILLLTGQGGSQQSAAALNAGADDYVVKPFNAEELVARVQALLRRGGTTAQLILSWGKLSLDPVSCKATYANQLLSVTPKEYAILELFLRNSQKVFNAKAILNQVWSSLESPGEEAVRVHIKEIRRKLKAAGAPQDFITTVYRTGYRLNPVYSTTLAEQSENPLTEYQIAELQSVNRELRHAIASLEIAHVELKEKNKALKQAQQIIRQDLYRRKQIEQQLQAARAALEEQVAERTTELEEANHSLEQQRNQWQSLFEHALDAIAIADDSGHYVDANPSACELFGVSRDELMGMTIADFADPTVDSRELWQQFLQQGQMSGEFRVHRPDGTTRETEFSAIANFMPGLHLSVLRDVSERARLDAERKQTAIMLQRQLERERLVAEITRYIHQTLDLDSILQRTVDQVRQVLQTDRVIIFRFQPHWQGVIVAESVAPGWPTTLSSLVNDPCFGEQYVEPYSRGRVSAIANVDAGDIQPCYVELLNRFQVKANLVVPILQRRPDQDDLLWGLLIAHHCVSPRQWEAEETELLQQLAGQLGIALQQSELYQQAQRELTERRQIQAALEASEELFRSLSESAPIGICQTDAEGECQYCNDRWHRMLNFTKEECSQGGWLKSVHPDDQGRLRDLWNAYLRGEQEFTGEFRVCHTDGEICWLSTHAAPIYSITGAIVGHVRTVEDMTQRKRAEQDLRDSEARYRLLFDSNPNPIWVVDLETLRFLTINEAALSRYGYSRDEFSNMGLAEVYPPGEEATLQHLQSELRHTQNYFGVSRHLKRDGSFMDVEQLARAFTFDGKQVSLVLINDITERLQAERKIREQAELLNIASDAIFVCDLDHGILYWNRGAEQLYGWSAEEVMGQRANQLLNENGSQVADAMDALMVRGEWQGEFRKLTKSGEEVIVADRWTLVRDEANQPRFVLSVSTDITEKKQLEAQFYHAQRLESLGTLAGGIAHDLNNVLTPILAISQIMRLTHCELDERSLDMLQLIETSAKRGAELIRQILTFVRGSEGKRVPVRLFPVLQEVVKVMQQTFPKSIEIRQAIPAQGLGQVLADPTHLHQVFINLCVNSRDAMPDGGTLTLTAANCWVDAAMAQLETDAHEGHYVVITVSDTGIGIPPDVRDRIFDPFFTTKDPGHGTGLGLSTVLGLIRNYGGFLRVASRVGEGTDFYVYLPVIEKPHLEDNTAFDLPRGNGERVLILEDDDAVRQTAQTVLESCNYRTLTAKTGADAIALYAQHQDDIHLVLLDIMMPDMDGISVVRRLKQMNPTVTIIACSGLVSNQAPVLSAGATTFLPKPYTVEHLLRLIYEEIQPH